MESEGALPSSQEPATGWVRRTRSTSSHPIFLRSSLILSSHLRLRLPCGLFLSGLETKIMYARLVAPCMLHALPISYSFILSP
jgi:hypothetical protein